MWTNRLKMLKKKKLGLLTSNGLLSGVWGNFLKLSGQNLKFGRNEKSR
jgi:hypothetical protein